MSFGLSISLFFIVGVLYIGIIDFYTMLLRITGLTQEKARFQVISLLTNSGYSTKESELVVEVLPRRRIARTIMIFGYVFSITIVSVFVNTMMSLPTSEKEEVWVPLMIVCTLFVIFMLIRRIPVVQEAFNTVLERAGRKWLYGDAGNPVLLQEEFPRGVIAAITLNKMPPDISGKTLRELQLPERHDLRIIYIRRGNNMLADVDENTKFDLHDEVVAFGPIKNIRNVFSPRPAAAEDDLKEAARPESANQFIHEQDLENASRAAHAERAREEAEARKKAEAKGAAAGPAAKGSEAAVKDAAAGPTAKGSGTAAKDAAAGPAAKGSEAAVKDAAGGPAAEGGTASAAQSGASAAAEEDGEKRKAAQEAPQDAGKGS